MNTKEMACSMINTCNLDDEAEKQTAAVQLLNELDEGEQSAAEQGWLSPEDVKRELELLYESCYRTFCFLSNPIDIEGKDGII